MPPGAVIKGRLKYRFPGLVRDIVSCAPSIKSLTLIATEDPTLEENNAFNVQIRSLIRALHDLEIVIFSPCFLTQAVVHSLSKARNLHTIIAAPARPVNRWEQLPPFSAAASTLFYRFLTHEQGDWESLRSYTSILSLEETENTLAQPNFPSHKLTDLTLLATGSYNFSAETLKSFIPNGAVQSFIHTVAMQCPSLERLHVDLEAPYVLPIEDAEEPDEIPLNIANLSHLGGLDSLTEFYLHDRRLLDMTEDELVDLVRQIPRLRILYLCHTPHCVLVPVQVEVDANDAIEGAPPPPAEFEFSLPESPFGMRIVSRIMEALPGLKELGIYLDISDDILPDHGGRASLDVLHVGNSPPPPLTLPSDAFLPYLSSQGKLAVGPQLAYRWGYPGRDMIQYLDQSLAGWSRFTSYSKSIYEVTMSVEALHPLF
ncbi:hypothetical protein PENSPDRAFT_695649 [Peniophora sp. CONT]|nr:hypothetical protein PENSPDRAFT_695649 [Peniophora sp. CONT]